MWAGAVRNVAKLIAPLSVNTRAQASRATFLFDVINSAGISTLKLIRNWCSLWLRPTCSKSKENRRLGRFCLAGIHFAHVWTKKAVEQIPFWWVFILHPLQYNYIILHYCKISFVYLCVSTWRRLELTCFLFVFFFSRTRHWAPLHVSFISFKSIFCQKKRLVITRLF